MKTCNAAILGALALSIPALAQSSIDPVNKWSWQENCGWMNWADANGGAQSARVHASFLSGFIWCENIGWVNLGDGSPANGSSYANTTGADSGVNLNPGTGALSGLAWGENVGWINFSGGALASPPQPARLDTAASRLRGFAWAENLGWINLDHATHFVGINAPPACDPDVNCDGSINGFDIEAMEQAVNGDFSNFCQPDADYNHDGSVNGFDIEAVEQGVNGGPCP